MTTYGELGSWRRQDVQIPRLLAAGALALTLAAQMGLNGLWFLLGLGMLIAYREIAPRRAQRRERARLLSDCHAQHDAWKRQRDAEAFFGRFQPWTVDSDGTVRPPVGRDSSHVHDGFHCGAGCTS